MAKVKLSQSSQQSLNPRLPIYVHDLHGDLNTLPVACLHSVTLQLMFVDRLHIQLVYADLWLQCVRKDIILLQIFVDSCSQPSHPHG